MLKKKHLTFLVSLAVIAILLSGCGKPFVCDFCGIESDGKSHSSSFEGVTMTICDDCYNDFQEVLNPEMNNINSDIPESDGIPKHISDIKEVYSIYPFVNGYACVMDSNYCVQYFDHKGQIVVSGNNYSDYENDILSFSGVFPAGKESVIIYDDSNYNLVTLNDGRILRSFPWDETIEIGGHSEGVFYVQEIAPNNTSNVVYYDEFGNEKMRFEGMVSLGIASNFSEGRAFICAVAEDETINGWQYRKDNPKDWTIIDLDGNSKKLKIVNTSELLSESVVQQLSELYYNPVDQLSVGGYMIQDVRPFKAGENYASAMVAVEYKDEDGRVACGAVLPAYITKQGEVYVCDTVLRGNIDFTSCNDNCIIINKESIFDYSNESLTNVRELPFYCELHDDGFVEGGITLRFLESGDFLVKIPKLKDSGYYVAVIDAAGNVISAPILMNYNVIYNLPDIFSVYENGYTNNYNYSEFNNGHHAWQENSFSQDISVINDLDMYCLISDSESFKVEYDSVQKQGYADIWGNELIAPQYSKTSRFQNGYSIVCREATGSWMLFGTDLSFIDSNGNVVSEVQLPPEHTYTYEPLSDTTTTPEEIISAVETILTTDTQFRIATDVAVLPTAAGEVAGYLYDIATFDLPGLVKHIYSDATYEYRDEAVNLILQSLISTLDSEQIDVTFEFMCEAERQLIAEGKQTATISAYCTKALKLLDDESYITGNLTAEDLGSAIGLAKKSFKSILVLDSLVEDLKLSVSEKLLISLLIGNYEENKAYLEQNITDAKRSSNSEMTEIYTEALEKLDSAYAEYVANAEEYIKDVFSGTVSFDRLVDLIELDLDIIGANPVKDTLKHFGTKSKNLNALTFVHSIAVAVAETYGTDDTYTIMQRLYENARVINGLAEDLQQSLSAYEKNPTESNFATIKTKAGILVDYRKIVLNNLRDYNNTCSSGEVFLDTRAIEQERLILDAAMQTLESALPN